MALLKLQAPLVGQQPNISAGGKATMSVVPGPRIGIFYAECTVTKAAGGSGVYSLPLLSDIIDPGRDMFVKMNGKPQFQRRALENAYDNALQSDKAKGSVTYWQGGVKIATAYDITNAVNPSALASNTATTAIFQVPIYFMQPWRKDPLVGEALAVPTLFQNGLTLPKLSFEVPVAPAAAGFSGHKIEFWVAYDNLVAPLVNGAPLPNFVRKARTEYLYSTTGDVTVPLDVRGNLQQFSLILASGDTFEKIYVKLNGAVIREVTKEENDQTIYDQELNIATVTQNRIDVVFDNNDMLGSAVPVGPADTLEVVATLASVAGAAQMVILTEVLGQPL
jgi:hypothetical protein